MGPALELEEKLMAEMEVRAGKENVGGVFPSTEEVPMPCVNLYEDKDFFAQSGDKAKSSGDDVEVNVVDHPLTTFDAGLEQVVDEDVTESMSSFGGSGFENDNGLGDVEVESQLRPDVEPESVFDLCGTSFGMRKKRLTEHWKRFIRPVMWRCKWIELQLKEFQAQVRKYDQELADHEQQKQFELGTFLAEGFHAKSLPLSRCTQWQKVMKRKKRKRIEETTDLASCIHHTVFSYYEHKKIASNGATLDYDCTNHDGKTNGNLDVGFQDGWAPIESEGGDNGEEFLRRIEAIQLLVRSLRTRVDNVVSEIPKKFSSVNILSSSAPSDPSSSSNPVPSSSLPNGASGHGDVAPLADIFDSVALRRAGENLCQNGEEQILIHNQATKDDMQDLRNFGRRLKEEHSSSLMNQPRQALDTGLMMESLATRVGYGGKSLPKSRSEFPMTIRCHGRKRTIVNKTSKNK